MSNTKHKEKTRLKWLNKRVELNTTNIQGERGTIIEIDLNSKNPDAFYGYHVLTQLDSGRVVTSYHMNGFSLIQ